MFYSRGMEEKEKERFRKTEKKGGTKIKRERINLICLPEA